jgi:hypothetical protein
MLLYLFMLIGRSIAVYQIVCYALGFRVIL